ncbi:MAG: hypothetical protein DRJ98_06655 [Thermoprotei archaeon]|nr:MAG: hypothetical protein DRJ98_06655 [Thermoprotei archaeon]
MKLTKIKAILTDLDGTLYRCPKYEAEIKRLTLEIVSEKLGVSVEEAQHRLTEARKICVTLTRSIEYVGVSRHYFYDELSKRLRYTELLKPDPKIAEFLRQLRSMGYKVAIITNSGRPHALGTMGALKIPLDAVDALITSSEVEPKTSPKPYLRGLELLGVPAKETVYMGDRVEDEVKPAKELGMITVLVSNQEVVSPWVDYVIDSPFKLLEVLKKLEAC